MKIKRKYHAVCYLEGYVYVIGGITADKTPTKTCERFSTEANVWQKIRSLSEAVAYANVCTFDNRFIFKFGGLNEYNFPDKTIER